MRGSRPGTSSAPPRAVCALAAPGLRATAKILPRRVWTAGSYSDGRVRAQSPRPLHPPLGGEPRGLSGRQPGPRGPLLSPPSASLPDLPKSPPVGARSAAPRPAPLTPGRVFCSCSALWSFSADSRSQ